MKLVPVTKSLAAVAELERRSPAAARTLVQLALFESLSDQIDAQRHIIEPVMLANMETVTKRARSRLLRDHVGAVISGVDEPDDLEVARSLAVAGEFVEKGLLGQLTGYDLDVFNRKHPRGPGGQFMSVNVAAGNPKLMSTESRQKAAHEAATIQAAQWKNGGLIDDNTELQGVFSQLDEKGVHIGPPANDPRHNPRFTLGQLQSADPDLVDALHSQLDPNTGRPNMLLTGMQVNRANISRGRTAERGAMDVMGAMMGNDQASQRLMRGLPDFNEQGGARPFGTVAENWYGLSGTAGGYPAHDRQAYRRMGMTGRALQRVSLPGSDAYMAGQLAQLAGEIGPEAEKVLGPGIRRTAYRYRGTERKPDRQVVTQVDDATKYADKVQDILDTGVGPEDIKVTDLSDKVPVKGGQKEPAFQIALHNMSPRQSEDERAMAVRGDAAVAYMLGVGGGLGASHLPDKKLTELSAASGEMPPSEGIMINERGQVVSQAVGYNGDHYLPFDLKNLHGLFGGQYVRTRATGGPSSEDIYTGLVTGTRQIQVVSNSGVFTLDFDPSLRGARRFNDKVKRMVGRYEEMLEAIAEGTLYEQDITPERMSELRREAVKANPSGQDEFNELLDTLVDRERMNAKLVDVEEDADIENAESWAQGQLRTAERNNAGKPYSRVTRADMLDGFRREYMDDIGAPQVRKLKLDGPGYERAMQALKQEFPYYIRQASWESLPEWLNRRELETAGKPPKYRAGVDVGRVQVGQTNPRSVATGALASAKASRRGVPSRKGTGAEEGQGTQAEETEETKTKTRTGSAAAILNKPVTEDVLTEMKKPGSDYFTAVGAAVDQSIGVLNEIDPPGNLPPENPTEADLKQMQAGQYAWVKIRDFTGTDARGGGKKFTDWLLNKAEPWERDKILAAARQVPGWMQGLDVPDFTQSSVQNAFGQLKDLIDTAEPFGEDAKPDATEVADLRVDEGNPKPWKYPDISHVNPPEEGKLFIREPHLRDHYESLGGMRAEDVADEINTKISEYRTAGDNEKPALLREVHDMHRAWAVVEAQHRAAELKKHGVEVGGAGPKGVGKSDVRPRRQLVFHDLSSASVIKSLSLLPSALRLRPAGRR